MTEELAKTSAVNNLQPNLCPLISVVVPVYNAEKYLSQCIESITSQTYRNLEIILVDDGSTDKSGAICDDYAEKDKRVKVIHKVNEGNSAARNTGLDLAKGEIIATVDDDDFLAPEMYEKLYKLLVENNADMSMCEFMYYHGSEDINSASEKTYPVEIINGEEFLYRLVMPGFSGAYLRIWNKLYKAELFKNVRFQPGNKHDDTSRIHRLGGECRRIALTQEVLYFNRSHDESVTGKIDLKKFNPSVHMKHFKDSKDAFDDRTKYLRSKGMNELAEFAELRSGEYAVMALMLQRLNYLQYRREVKEITGTTPLKLIIKLITSKHRELKMRGLKLGIIWFRSFFRPFIKSK
ncbi:MAG: glycosyltransferase [Synergistaceae bacterium]|nr:glycosyltransferase [Synergistaceae bacterium]